MDTLTVALGERSYPIHIGADLLGNPGLLKPHLRSSQVCIVTNTTVQPLYAARLRAALLPHFQQVYEVALPDGEEFKDWNGNDGALLQLWDCGGTANQKWRRA